VKPVEVNQRPVLSHRFKKMKIPVRLEYARESDKTCTKFLK